MASRARLRRLHDANDEMFGSLDLGHRLRIAVKSARDLLSADAAAVFLPNEGGNELVIRAHDGLSASYAARQKLPMDEVRAQVRAAGEHVILDMPSGSVGDHALIQAEGLAKLLSIPLFFQEKLTGVLVVYSKHPKRVFEPDDIELAHLLAATTAIGITNSRLYAEALAQQDLHRHLLEALGDGVLIGWPNGNYEANPRAREILGVPQFETLGELRDAVDVKDLMTGRPIPPGAYPLDRAMRGETTKGDFLVTRPDTGERRDVEVSAAPVRGANDEIVAGVMTLHDITDLLSSEREREQFLSIVSHELRTPLTPLKALAQLQLGRLRRSQARGTPMDLEALERNLESIERQVDRMNGLVSDLLSVSRAGRGKLDMDPAPFDLAAEVRDVVGRYVAASREEGRHSFAVEAPEALTYDGDQARIDQLLMNLIGNAVKYSPRGGQVAVKLARQNGAAEIAISDPGIGIPADDLPRLGSAFTRGIGKAATFAGMGIGLYVAKLVAERHGGSLQLESAGEDKGTTVRVRLPL